MHGEGVEGCFAANAFRCSMSKYGNAACEVCARVFKKKHPSHKYCHWQCQAAKNRRRIEERRAEVANLEPRESSLVVKEADGVDASARGRRAPRGRYVYVWINDDSNLPFYVGKGVDKRAWDRHCLDDGRSMWCQQIRSVSSGFRVVIVRDNLTNEGAMLLESSLISFISQIGGLLSNQVDPLKRQENPPLELAQTESGNGR